MGIITRIRTVLDEIRPSIVADGGDISLVRFDKGILYIKLHGACRTCPVSTLHIKMGIESFIKERVPAVESIIVEE